MQGIRDALIGAALLALWWAPAHGQGGPSLYVAMRDGYVTLEARDVTLHEILDRWAEVGHVTILNAHKLPASPMTLSFSHETERSALDILLRSLGGYVLSERTDPGFGARIDRIVVVPSGGGLSPSSAVASRTPVTPAEAAATSEAITSSADVAVEASVRAPENEPARPRDRSARTSGFGAARAATDPDAAPGARPIDALIKYADGVDEAGNRLRAPTVDHSPPPAPDAKGAAVNNPFGVTAGSTTPGMTPAPPAKK